VYDKEESAEQRAADYRKIIQDGADVIESDRPIEAAAAVGVAATSAGVAAGAESSKH